MSSDPSRRFTDREVAVVLRQAVEIDERAGSESGGGLSLADLADIAREVGISQEAIQRAVDSLDSRRSLAPGFIGAPLVRKSVHAVDGELSKEAIARLVRVIDEHTDATGSISEALGSVRWTSSDRLRSSLVSITPEKGETTIRVVEKAVPRIRRVFHFLPAAWAVMIAAPIIAAGGLGPLGAVAATGLSLAAGVAVGRAAWSVLSAQSGGRVARLGTALAEEAKDASARGLLAGGGESTGI